MKTVLIDNQKAAVLKNNNGKVVFNSGFLLLADHYGSLPRVCRPRRAKGKVERMVTTGSGLSGRSNVVHSPGLAIILGMADLRCFLIKCYISATAQASVYLTQTPSPFLRTDFRLSADQQKFLRLISV